MFLPGHRFRVLTFSCPQHQALSESFSGDIPDEHITSNSFFPDEYFTCSSICLSCGYVSPLCLPHQLRPRSSVNGLLGGPLSALAVKEA